MNKQQVRTAFLLALFVAVTTLPGLGSAYLFDWDEANFAECAREMLASGDYLHPRIDYEPFWEKPPLFFWCQAASMHIFGVNEFAARFPNAIIGIATILLIYGIGTKWVDHTFGFLWSLTWIGSLLPQFYMHSGLIDPLFNLLMFASLILAITALEKSTKHQRFLLLLCGFFLGLAILTKGPVAILLIGIPLLWIWFQHYRWHRVLADSVVVLCMALLPSALWLFADHSEYGQWFLWSFVEYQVRLLTTGDAGHSGPFYYHLVVLLLGCFPASFLAFGTLYQRNRIPLLHIQTSSMTVVLLVVVVVFSIVQTKIVHYTSMAYFPITYMAALVLYRWWNKTHLARPRWIAIGTSILGLVLIGTPFVLRDTEFLLSVTTNEFTRALIASANPRWSGLEWLGGALALSSALCCFFLSKRSVQGVLVLLFVSHALAVSCFIRLVAPRIQDFTQRAIIEVCQSYQRDHVIVQPIGFKTYLHLFYTKRPLTLSPQGLGISRDDWERYLLEGTVPADVVFIAKRPKAPPQLSRAGFIPLAISSPAWLFVLRPSRK